MELDNRTTRPDRGWWTEERAAELKERWLNGESASEIEEAMQAPSRSAVIGKAYRLGLAGIKGERTKQQQTSFPKVRQVVYIAGRYLAGRAPPMVETPQTPFRNAKRFIVLKDRECHWPGDGQPGPDLLCCGEPVVEGRPYCVAHCRQAYVHSALRPPKL